MNDAPPQQPSMDQWGLIDDGPKPVETGFTMVPDFLARLTGYSALAKVLLSHIIRLHLKFPNAPYVYVSQEQLALHWGVSQDSVQRSLRTLKDVRKCSRCGDVHAPLTVVRPARRITNQYVVANCLRPTADTAKTRIKRSAGLQSSAGPDPLITGRSRALAVSNIRDGKETEKETTGVRVSMLVQEGLSSTQAMAFARQYSREQLDAHLADHRAAVRSGSVKNAAGHLYKRLRENWPSVSQAEKAELSKLEKKMSNYSISPSEVQRLLKLRTKYK